ncbi:metallophosphoesterase [Verrucomicrobiota bacterium]
MEEGTFTLWAIGDAHVGTDLKHGRTSLADTLRTSEHGGDEGGPPFDWNIAVDIGDMSGGQDAPQDPEGEEVVRQFAVLEKHGRESIYNICGNHDRSGLAEPPAWWWQKWVDPIGEHTEFSGVDPLKRPYPIDGTWERYSFRVGNVLFLMMSDINEPTQTVGRGDLGGNPAGVVSGETFDWWKSMVESNPDSIIISAHHYMLKDTTVASGEWEGMRQNADGQRKSLYHGYCPQGAPKGASYLYFVDSKPDACAFENFLQDHPGSVDIWLGGHTHTHPDDTCGGKSHIETRWKTHFINAACISRFHGGKNVPKTRVLTFREGSREVQVRCYMHTSEFMPQGWYAKAERVLKISRPFRH